MKRLTVNDEQMARSNQQEVRVKNSVVHDTDYPVFPTPVNKKVIVYIPEVANLFTSVVHDIREGMSYGKVRCINGLADEFKEFGYTGECPFCKHLHTAWDNFNMKLDLKAKEMNIDKDNDTDGVLKGTRSKLLHEMRIKNPQKYIVVPIVVIGEGTDGRLYDDGNPYFVFWTYDRWVKKVKEVLDEEGITSGSVFMRWSFTYDTKGRQATPMESAKALTAKVITPSDEMKAREAEYKDMLSEFTVLKAVDNIKALNFYTYDDMEKYAGQVISKSERELAQYEAGGVINLNEPATLDITTAIADFGNSKS